MNLKTSVVVPVYNEGALIVSTIKNISLSLKNSFEILICYDFDEDDTLFEIQKRFSNQFVKSKIRFIKNSSCGPHSAVMSGIKKSIGDFVIVIPADDSINSKKLNNLVDVAERGFDIVCPSRYIKGGAFKGAPFFKFLINKIVNYLMKLSGLPSTDATNGFRLFSRKIIKNIDIKSSSGFLYSIEYLIKAHDKYYRIIDYPSIWIERNKGESRFRLGKWCFAYLKYFIYGIYIGLKRRIYFER
jgi:dolichol-phosphate mannosyltransferase